MEYILYIVERETWNKSELLKVLQPKGQKSLRLQFAFEIDKKIEGEKIKHLISRSAEITK